MIGRGTPVGVSLAPSYICAFREWEPERVVGGLKLLGFTRVEETASVLPHIVAERKRSVDGRLTASGRATEGPVLSTSCPRFVDMVRSDFPHLERYLFGLPAPMTVHCLELRKRVQGPVVFIGPCPFKADEAECTGAADGVLTFAQLGDWFREEGIGPENAPPLPPDVSAPYWTCASLLAVEVSGMDRCEAFLRGFPETAAGHEFIEALACEEGCLY
ncbi:MAG: [Fe-Fe] hydrogenase large subunit C-terminal domain-containing protein, partial [Anaerolineae bacterium]